MGSALEPARGEWEFETDSWFWAPALLDGNVVYASTLAGEVFALDTRSGRALWPEPGRVEGQIVASPIVMQTPAGKALAVPSGDEDVWVIDAISGLELNKFDTSGGVKAAPIVIDNFIYVHTLDKELAWYSINDRTSRGCLKLPSGERCT